MKRIVSLILVTLLIVSLFAFVGCSNTNETQQKIEELQATVNQLSINVSNLTEEIAKLQEKLNSLANATLERLKEEAIWELEAIVNKKEENWSAIENILTETKAKVSNVTTIEELNALLFVAKEEINGILTKMEELLKHFDLTDPKEYWSGTLEELKNYCPDDRIVVVLRRTETYPIITPEDLPFGNIASIGPYPYYPGYEMSPTPEWVKEWEERYGREYRVVLEVELKEKGHENVYQALLAFQSLDFVKTVYPPKLLSPPYDPIYPENNRDKEV